ncbi:ribonuclease H1 domain-containing protein [Aquirufa aurantiipilula]|uniref:ribonuclease H1 domain-containing protein n=1 Tax=Aquirufa aurantiipilula TaxID=2696561 RepID=UPI001CAA63F7|nr:ribonuclease H family protein [Aquirufa aurantiipilula]MBZ1325849.1 ribonuclease H [Aquirufa aurantiipilula]
MSKKQKYYVIWAGHETGIFDSWGKAEKLIKNFPGAQYKSFDTKAAAEEAFKKNYWASIDTAKKTSVKKSIHSQAIITPSISVDAACSGNPGVLEYQGVNTETKEVLFAQGPYPIGTVNLGEFLAIVHGLAYLKKIDCPFPLYSDSRTAIAWVRNKAIKTNLERNAETEELFQRVDKAIAWLKGNFYQTKILKWETEHWGENPADYGRK